MVENIKKEFAKLIKAVSETPEKYQYKKEIEFTGGPVSVSDLISYQIGWGKLLISWYDSGLQNKKFTMPGCGFDSWDYEGLAIFFYKKHENKNIGKQLNEFEKVVKEIISIVDKEETSGNLKKLGVWPWCTLASGKEWPLSKWIQVNTVAPYKRATAIVKKYNS